MSDDKIVGLDGKTVVFDDATGPGIIKILEDALALAREHKMVACCIQTMMAANRSAQTATSIEFGFHTEMVGVLDIAKDRIKQRIEDDNP